MGIGDAVYHAYDELTFVFGSCSINKVFSCQAVFASGYTQVLGVEFWVYGVVWFPAVLALGIWTINRYGIPRRNVLVPFLMIGNIFTLYPWDIEIRLLHGVYCLVCISLYCINYALTGVALLSGDQEPVTEVAPERVPAA